MNLVETRTVLIPEFVFIQHRPTTLTVYVEANKKSILFN